MSTGSRHVCALLRLNTFPAMLPWVISLRHEPFGTPPSPVSNNSYDNFSPSCSTTQPRQSPPSFQTTEPRQRLLPSVAVTAQPRDIGDDAPLLRDTCLNSLAPTTALRDTCLTSLALAQRDTYFTSPMEPFFTTISASEPPDFCLTTPPAPAPALRDVSLTSAPAPRKPVLPHIMSTLLPSNSRSL